MSENSFHKNFSSNTPPQTFSVVEKLKNTYLIWYSYYLIIPKIHRYSLGQKIDILFTDAIELIVNATFISKTKKLPVVKLAARKIDTLKFFLLILWETKSLDSKKYIQLSVKLNELGKILNGWQGQLIKQNSPK